MSQFRRASIINLSDLMRALPSRPGATPADKMRTAMVTAGQTARPIKEGRAIGGVSCPKCGHSHAAGSICAYMKGLESWLTKANFGPDRYHYGKDDPRRGENGTFAPRGGSKGGTDSGGTKASTPKAKSGNKSGHDEPTQVDVPEDAIHSMPENARAPSTGPSIEENPTDYWKDAQQEWGATPSRMAAREQNIKGPVDRTSPDRQQEQAFDVTQMANPSGGGNASPDSGTKNLRRNPVSSQIGTDPTMMAGPNTSPDGAPTQENEQAQPSFLPWHMKEGPAGVHPAHHQQAQVAAKQAYDQAFQSGVSQGMPPQQANDAANQQAHGAYAQQLFSAQQQPMQTQQPVVALQPPGQSPPMTPAAPASPPSAMPGQPGQPPVPTQQGSEVQKPKTSPSAPPPTNMGSRIAGMIPDGSQARAIGAGLGTPGGTIGPSAGALAQPVHSLLGPSKQPKNNNQGKEEKPKTSREQQESAAHDGTIANYGKQVRVPPPPPPPMAKPQGVR